MPKSPLNPHSQSGPGFLRPVDATQHPALFTARCPVSPSTKHAKTTAARLLRFLLLPHFFSFRIAIGCIAAELSASWAEFASICSFLWRTKISRTHNGCAKWKRKPAGQKRAGQKAFRVENTAPRIECRRQAGVDSTICNWVASGKTGRANLRILWPESHK